MEDKIRAGNSDQITRTYFDSLAIEMRHIDAVKPNLRFELFGEVFDSPIMGAALSHINLHGENGMVELAKGMAKSNAVMWAGMGDEIELEQIIETGAKTIKIIKPYEDRQLILKKMERARELGVLAIGIDIDHAFAGNGEPDVVLNHPMKGISMEELKGFVSSYWGFYWKTIAETTSGNRCRRSLSLHEVYYGGTCRHYVTYLYC